MAAKTSDNQRWTRHTLAGWGRRRGQGASSPSSEGESDQGGSPIGNGRTWKASKRVFTGKQRENELTLNARGGMAGTASEWARKKVTREVNIVDTVLGVHETVFGTGSLGLVQPKRQRLLEQFEQRTWCLHIRALRFESWFLPIPTPSICLSSRAQCCEC